MPLTITFLIFWLINFAAQEPALSPSQAQKSFVLPAGLKIELVASEPMIQDPIIANFDEKGRLWVVEMRGYMPDIEGNGEDEPIGRISVLEDINADGQMDKATTFLDSLVLPRAMAFVKNGILFAHNGALYQATDANHDLIPEQVDLIDKDYAGSTAPEHAANGLLRAYDGWFYNAKSRFRYKQIAGVWQKDSTEFRGQFGIANDDQGRLYYNYNWSQLHADLVPPNYLSRNKNHSPSSGIDYAVAAERSVYPIRETPAANRGYIPRTLDKNGRLQEFTAACSPFIFRSQALGSQYYGNAFVCEPVGNLVKRNVFTDTDVMLIASDPNPGHEFLASTDERFRPVSFTSGPSGALYVVDMYKGLIQHKLYETPYLKDQYKKRGLDGPLHMGRIWRITQQNAIHESAIDMSKLSNTELLNKLYSPSAWERETASRLILDANKKELLPALNALAKRQPKATERVGENFHLARLMAFNIINQFGSVSSSLIKTLLADNFTPIANAALRQAEILVKAKPILQAEFLPILQKLLPTATEARLLQYLLSASMFEPTTRINFLQKVIAKQDLETLYRDATMSTLQGQEYAFLQKIANATALNQTEANQNILIETLVQAIINNRNTSQIEKFLADIQSKKFGKKEGLIVDVLAINAIVVEKAIPLKTEPAILKNKKLAPITAQKIAKIFTWPGKVQPLATTTVALLQKPEDLKSFVKGRQQYLSVCSGCHGSNGKGLPRFAPPLAGSEWVTGPEQRLALLVLQGIEGAIEVAGKKYDAPDILPVMPAMSTTDDATITNILNYIRNEWGNNAGPVSRSLIGRTRFTNQGHMQPWTVPELNRHVDSLLVLDKK